VSSFARGDCAAAVAAKASRAKPARRVRAKVLNIVTPEKKAVT
jgi:hypothetical protein